MCLSISEKPHDFANGHTIFTRDYLASAILSPYCSCLNADAKFSPVAQHVLGPSSRNPKSSAESDFPPQATTNSLSFQRHVNLSLTRPSRVGFYRSCRHHAWPHKGGSFALFDFGSSLRCPRASVIISRWLNRTCGRVPYALPPAPITNMTRLMRL